MRPSPEIISTLLKCSFIPLILMGDLESLRNSQGGPCQITTGQAMAIVVTVDNRNEVLLKNQSKKFST